MLMHGLRRNRQTSADLLVREALCRQTNDTTLHRREPEPSLQVLRIELEAAVSRNEKQHARSREVGSALIVRRGRPDNYPHGPSARKGDERGLLGTSGSHGRREERLRHGRSGEKAIRSSIASEVVRGLVDDDGGDGQMVERSLERTRMARDTVDCFPSGLKVLKEWKHHPTSFPFAVRKGARLVKGNRTLLDEALPETANGVEAHVVSPV